MSLLQSKPLKFKCQPCNKVYLHYYKPKQRQYPHCPSCKQAGSLLGSIEAEDLLRHPVEFVTSYIKQTLYKPGKSH